MSYTVHEPDHRTTSYADPLKMSRNEVINEIMQRPFVNEKAVAEFLKNAGFFEANPDKWKQSTDGFFIPTLDGKRLGVYLSRNKKWYLLLALTHEEIARIAAIDPAEGGRRQFSGRMNVLTDVMLRVRLSHAATPATERR
jgi:hypothetical protein